jgi:predicted RNA-binding protein with PIN domain
MSKLLIDGFNLIHCPAFPGAPGNEDTETLLELLRRYKKFKGHTITVVFDGYEKGMPLEHTERVKGIRVIYSKLGEKADQVIERLARQWGGSCVVVTSDREVAASVERSQGTVIAAEEFMERLTMAEYFELKGEEVSEEKTGTIHTRKKGNPRKKSKKERARLRRLKKL